MGRKHRKHKKPLERLTKKRKIATALGEGRIHPDTKVKVFIDKNNYVVKRVRNLRKGDRILFNKSYIQVTDENDSRILQGLESNPVYRHAREQIFYRYSSEEDKVTMLRKLLLEGLISHGYLDAEEETQRKIILDGTDFSQDEIWIARNGLEEILRNNSSNQETPSESSYRNWIDNTSVLTIGKYLPLLEQVNPELAGFSDKEGDRYQAYVFWKACRQQVGKALRTGDAKDPNSKSNGKKADNNTSKLRLVVKDVVGSAIEAYDNENVITTVLSNETDIPGPDSEKGAIISGESENGNSLTLEELMKDFKALHSTFDYIISGHGIYTGLVEDFRAGLDEAVLARNLEKLGIKIVSQIFRGASEEIDTKKVDSVMNDIISGKIDETYKLPEGMTQKLLHILTRVASLIPEEVVEFGDVAAKIALWPKAAVEAEELVERAKYLSKKVKRDYEEDLIDILKHGTLSTLLKTGRIQEESGHFGEKELGDLVSIVNERDYSEEKLILLRKMQEETKEYCKRNNLELISGKDLQKIHEKYGVGPLATINVINYLPDFWACLKEKRKNEEHLPRNANPEWMKYATKGHQDLVDRLIENPEIIESGLELMQSEYNFGEGWARADIVYKDRNGNPLVVEVKQNAVRNGDGFDNALKAVEQTAGYRAAVEAILDYCPLTREQDHNVRGMLVAYNIDDDAKTALEKNECEYKEIARDEGEE